MMEDGIHEAITRDPGSAGPDPGLTRLLSQAAAGDRAASEQVLATVYEHLRNIARQRMGGERAGHTLQATALVHEAYVRLLGKQDLKWNDRTHFFRAAADAMRKILIDHARARNADKRGGGRQALHIGSVADLATSEEPAGVLAFDDAILRLEEADPHSAEVVRLRFYAGLTEEEAAEALGISARTVRREWAFARAWLRDHLERACGLEGE